MPRRRSDEEESGGCCQSTRRGWTGFWEECGLGSLWIFLAILAVIGIATFVLWLIFSVDPGPRGINVGSGSNSDVILELTSSNDKLVVQQTSKFKKPVYFQTLNATTLVSTSATITTLMLLNGTSGTFYNLDSAIEEIQEDQEELDSVLGMPDLQTFLQNYYNETQSLMRKRSLTRGPNVVTFLYDTENNVTALQQQLVLKNSSFYVNANFAYYGSQATAIPASPTSTLVTLTASGTFGQQTGVVLTSNAFSVTKAGTYMIAYNIAITQPASALTETVSLLVGSSALATSTLSWLGGSTGQSSTSQMAQAVLAPTDVVKLSITASATGAAIYTPGTQISVWNIS